MIIIKNEILNRAKRYIGKTLSNKYGQKIIDTAEKSTTDATKTASKRAIQKTSEATGYLIGNKIADKITSISKKPVKELPTTDEDAELTIHKKDTYHLKEDNKLLMN